MVKACQVDLSNMNEMELKRLQERIDRQIEDINKFNFEIDRITCKYNARSEKYILCLGVDQRRFTGGELRPIVVNKEIYKSEDINEVLTYVKTLKETLSKVEELLEATILVGGE